MRISAQFSLWGSAVFALFCVGFAYTGFNSLSDITDPQQLADARGFAWFWAFLAGVAIAAALASWWIVRQEKRAGNP